LGPLGIAITYRPTVPAPGDYDDGEIGGMIGRETKVLGEILPQCPTCCPDANPGRLSYGTAFVSRLGYRLP
jgi:hypothetical protein